MKAVKKPVKRKKKELEIEEIKIVTPRLADITYPKEKKLVTYPVEPEPIKEVKAPSVKEKRVYPSTMVPSGHVRCLVIRDHEGMACYHYVGDVIDLPERRFKSLSFRGLVKEYKGESGPTTKR